MKQPRMKIAQIVQKNLASIGYRADLRPFNKQQLWILLERMLILVSLFVYLFHVATTFRQYMDAIFMTTVGILMYISLVSTIAGMETIFILIDEMEQIINESE